MTLTADTLCKVFLVTLSVSLAAGECQSGWTRHGDACYHFSIEEEAWEAALEICEKFSSSLAEINSISEGDYLSTHAQMLDDDFWIGGHDLWVQGDWMWIKGQQAVNYTGYDNWKVGEPNNYKGMENCMVLTSDGEWNDNGCYHHKRYICEHPLKLQE